MKSNFDPMNVENMIEKKIRNTLELLMLLKEKRSGASKVRACVYSRK